MQIAVEPSVKRISSIAPHETKHAATGALQTYERHPSVPDGPTPAGANMSRDAKLLIVDDDEFSLWMTCATLRNAGFVRLNSTTDPEKVLERCDRFDPDVILIDLLMPRLDGISLIEALRHRLPANRYVPILVITGNLSADARQKAVSMGVNDFVTKPFDAETLVNSVRNLLDQQTIGQRIAAAPQHRNFRWPPPAAPSNPSGETLRLLIAEDSVDDRVLLQHYLKDTHYQQTFVEDGERAVALFETGAYDLILMDINMPRMDGLAATRLTRTLEEKRRLTPTPILALTGSCMARDVAACVQAGCTAHLAKPISKQELLSKIDRYTKPA